MELSTALSNLATRFFAKDQCWFEVFEKKISNDYHVVVARFFSEQGNFIGTASGSSRRESLIRACVEAGESEIVDRLKLNSRSGIAGGLFIHTASKRAKLELVERDALLHHYRNREPFEKLPQKPKQSFDLYLMRTLIPNVFSVLAAQPLQHDQCLKFGMGTSTSIKLATAKAIGELQSILLDHAIRGNYCKEIFREKQAALSLADFHHSNSWDERNREIFSHLFTGQSPKNRDQKNVRFQISSIQSKLKWIKYVQVRSADLQNLEFGVPEPHTTLNAEPLFLPIW